MGEKLFISKSFDEKFRMKKTLLIAFFLIFNMCNGGKLFSSSLSDVEEVWCKSAISAVRDDRIWLQMSSSSIASDPISYDGYYLKDRFLSKSLIQSMEKISGFEFDESETYKRSFGIPEDETYDYLFLFSTSDNEVVQENRISLCKLWYQVNLNN